MMAGGADGDLGSHASSGYLGRCSRQKVGFWV